MRINCGVEMSDSPLRLMPEFISNVWVQLAIGLFLLVIGWKMTANGANAVLLIAWLMFIACIFRSPWTRDLEIVPRLLTTGAIASVLGLAIYYTLWTQSAKPTTDESSRDFTVAMTWGNGSFDESKPTDWFAQSTNLVPVYYHFLVNLTSHLPKSVLIDSYVLEQQVNAEWVAAGPEFGVSDGRFFHGTDLSKVEELKYITLESSIENRNISPEVTLRGWLFQTHPVAGLTRLKLFDALGNSYTAMIGRRNVQGWPNQPLMIQRTGKFYDLSAFPRITEAAWERPLVASKGPAISEHEGKRAGMVEFRWSKPRTTQTPKHPVLVAADETLKTNQIEATIRLIADRHAEGDMFCGIIWKPNFVDVRLDITNTGGMPLREIDLSLNFGENFCIAGLEQNGTLVTARTFPDEGADELGRPGVATFLSISGGKVQPSPSVVGTYSMLCDELFRGATARFVVAVVPNTIIEEVPASVLIEGTCRDGTETKWLRLSQEIRRDVN